MKFVDSCDVDVIAGRGGNGAIAFRREKYIPFGGPSGGDGGKGGDVVFVADEGMSTLLDLAHVRALRAPHGEHGQGKDCYGRGGKDLVVRVPVGTQVFDRETGDLLFDVDEPNAHVVVARGGKGGRGNIHFATPYDRAPRRAEPGEPGEEKKLRLELKVMADVGLLGFPNVGKSTFIRACSRARPKVADYPFTTLTPQLGVVRIGDEASFVMADIPGLIPGAAEGAGLGLRFLKHVERTRALLHLVTLDPGEGRDPVADYDALRDELRKFDPELAKRPEIVAMTKADLPEVREAYEAARKAFAKKKIALRLVSAATGEGVRPLLVDLYRTVTGQAHVEDWEIEEPAARQGAEPEEAPTAEPPSPAEASRREVPHAPAKAASARETAAKELAARAVTRKAAGEKAATKKASTEKTATKKAPTKKAATKKASTRKASTRKTATKKAAAKKPASKRSATKKPAKKAAAGKAATKGATRTNRATAAKKPARRPAARSKTAEKAKSKSPGARRR